MRRGCAVLLTLFTLFYVSSAQGPILIDASSGAQYIVERYVSALFPVGMVFAPDGRLFYNEKETGAVRVVSSEGQTQSQPVIAFPINALVERGLLGIALDPDYEENGYIWVYYTASGSSTNFPANQIARFREENGVGRQPEVMFRLPIENGQLIHNGGNLHFDHKGALYVSIGDYGEAANAQDISVMQGKIHRFLVTEAGLAPHPDNPFENSIYAYGLRNPFDFAFDPVTGNIFATENGPNCDDELNLILPGFNYGWSAVYRCAGTELIEGLILYHPPLLSFTPPIAPTGIIIYDHPAIPEWRGDLFFCDFVFGVMRRVVLDKTRAAVEAVHEIDLGDVDCRLDVVVGPEGGIYFGTIGAGDGAIYRLLPAD